MKKSNFERRLVLIIMSVILIAWGVFHYHYKDVVIVHDSWQHIFPIVFSISTIGNCLDVPLWLGSVDNGSPVVIYLISFSLTQLLRIPLLFLWQCTQPDILTAIWQYKLQIYLTYAFFSGSMYFLGRLIFKSKISAIYLFATTLFAGLCIDSSHSNQVVSILFWFPWIIAAGYLYHHSSLIEDRTKYLNFLVILICAQLLDQYPHFTVLACTTGGIVYLFLNPANSAIPRKAIFRMWPALLAIGLTIWHLLVIKKAIAGYAPSLRSDLIVDPSSFGETGFVQPTALFASLLPMTFLAGFDAFGNGMAKLLHFFGTQANTRWFIFKLDMLLFSVGWIPLMLSLVFILSRDACTSIVRRGWIIFGSVMLAVSLQQTHLYLLIFHLPFFNVFRSYFLFIVFAMFSLLVISGYGMDKLLSVTPSIRAELVIVAVKRLIKLLAICFVFLVLLTILSPERSLLFETLPRFLLLDLIMLGSATALTFFAVRLHSPYFVVIIFVFGTALPQMFFSSTAYKMTGITDGELVRSFSSPSKEASHETSGSNLPLLTKRQCKRFAECYVSDEPMTSLNLNHDGTFLRNKSEPVFASGLSSPMLDALSRIDRPTSWLSQSSEFVSNRASAIARLNEMTADPDKGLSAVTFVYDPLILSKGGSEPVLGKVMSESRNGEKMTVNVETDSPMILNISNNFSTHWRITVNGSLRLPVFANLGNIAANLGAGVSTIELTYFSFEEWALILSRVTLVFVSLLTAIQIVRQASR